MNATKWLGVMVALQVLTLAGVWAGNGGGQVLPQAQAQAMDAGSQRQQIVDQLKTLNAKMDRLVAVLEGGKLQVQVERDDEGKEGR